MPLTDREAADRRTGEATGKAARILTEAIQAQRRHAMGFRNGLIAATEQLADALVAVYAPLCAKDESLRDELVATVKSRVLAFIQSSVASHQGTNGAMAARLGAQLAGNYSGGMATKFDLAVYDLLKAEERTNRTKKVLGDECRRAVLITALPLEFTAVTAHLVNIREENVEGSVYDVGLFEAPTGAWDVLVAETGAGNHQAAAETARALEYFKPSVAIFVGVAGGIKDVVIGDVVAASAVHGYERAKESDDETLVRTDSGKCTHALVQRARAEARKGRWTAKLSSENGAPKAVVGSIAAGEKVVASTLCGTAAHLKRHFSDALAVEMEGRGFVEAAQACSGVEFIVVRGVSDMLGGKNADADQRAQPVAAENASAFAFSLLEHLFSA